MASLQNFIESTKKSGYKWIVDPVQKFVSSLNTPTSVSGGPSVSDAVLDDPKFQESITTPTGLTYTPIAYMQEKNRLEKSPTVYAGSILESLRRNESDRTPEEKAKLESLALNTVTQFPGRLMGGEKGAELVDDVARSAAKVAEQKVPSFWERLAAKVSQTDKVVEPGRGSIYTPENEKRIFNTINAEIPGNNAAQKLVNSEKVIADAGGKIRTIMATSPKSAPVGQIETVVQENLKPLITAGKITPEQATEETKDLVVRLYNAAIDQKSYPPIENISGPAVSAAGEAGAVTSTGNSITNKVLRDMRYGQGNFQSKTGGVSGSLAVDTGGALLPPSPSSPVTQFAELPETIPDQYIYNMKQEIGKQIRDLYNPDGSLKDGLSIKDQVMLAQRNGLDTILTDLHPDVKAETLLQSRVYEAAPYLKSMREQNPSITLGIPGKILGQTPAEISLPGGFSGSARTMGAGVLKSDIAKTVGGLALAGGVGAGANQLFNNANTPPEGEQQNNEPKLNGYGSQTQNNNPSENVQGDQNHLPTIPQGRYTIQTPAEDGTVQGAQEFANTQAEIQGKIKQAELNDPQQAAILKDQLAQNQTLYDAQQPLRDLSTRVIQTREIANNTFNDLEKADPSIFNVLAKGYDALAKSSDGKYAGLAANLEYLSKLADVDLTDAGTKEALTQRIDAIMQQLQVQMAAQIAGSYSGGLPTIPQKTQPAQLPTALPEIPQGFKIGGGEIPPLNLPPLPGGK